MHPMNRLNIKSGISLLFFTLIFSLQIFAQQTGDYNQVIKSADEYYQKKDYYNAKAAYQLAGKLKPDDEYAKKRVQEIIDLLKAEMAVRGDYDNFISMADEAFQLKDYQTAITNFEKALNLIAYETHPRERLADAKRLLEASQLKKSLYEETIKTADQYFVDKNYEKAMSYYRDAAHLDESQKYPNDQILKITDILKTDQANKIAFEQAVQKGDQHLNYQKFADALASYEQALKVNPTDAYASAQVAKMKVFIQKEKEYDAFTAKADEHYVAQKLTEAKAQYQKALQILPEKTYAFNMIAKIDASQDKEKSKQQKLEADYAKAIADGDQLFKEKKYQLAFSKYTNALELKPNEEYPKSQLAEIDILLATGFIEIDCFVHEENKGLFDARIQLMQNGNVIETAEIGTSGRYKFKLELNQTYQIRLFKENYVNKIFDANTALPKDVNHNNIYKYDLIVELFPLCSADLSILDEPLTEITYHRNKGNFYIDEQRAQIIIDRVNELKKECDKIRKEEAGKQDYNDLIAKADKFLEQKNYTKALENYTAASVLLPNEQYPKQKIAEIKALLEATDKYQALIASGDAKFKAKDYENALYDYYAAKNLSPKEVYPQQKIDEIDGLLGALKDLNARYDAKIKMADGFFGNDSLLQAQTAYKEALLIKAEEQYTKNQLAEISKRLNEKTELEKRYKDAVAVADNLFTRQKLNDARSAYLVASQIKPNEMYPKYKIEDINTIEEQQRLRAMDNDYSGLIAKGDAEFNNKQYIAALSLYERAAEVKPKETYPKAQIEIIRGILAQQEADGQKYNELIALADKQFDAKEYAPSFDNYKLASGIKPAEAYPKSRMAEIEAIMKKLADQELAYQEAIKQADGFFANQNYTSALPVYQKASNIKPSEQYPKDKINEINGLLQGLANKEAAYAAAIKEGDLQFKSAQWTPALTAYQTALGFKPNEKYPQDKINEINKKLGDLAQIKASYDALIAQADALFTQKSYLDSKTTYQKALTIFPKETYPPQRIAEIDAILKALAETDASYLALIEKADRYFKETKWDMALTAYESALDIKPLETYPKNQIQLCKDKLGQAAALRAQYDALILAADGLFNSKSYTESKGKYQQALAMFPQETYPAQRIAEIDRLRKEMADKDALYQQYIKSGDQFFTAQNYNPSLDQFKLALTLKPNEEYPKQKIAEIEAILLQFVEKDRLYQEAIQYADKSRNDKVYELAITKYQEASAIKPQEKYPKEQIKLLQDILKGAAATQAAYDAALAQADKDFAASQWNAALAGYNKALGFKPNEVYPQTQIQEINRILAELAELEANYKKAIVAADGFYKTKSWQESLTQYQLANKLKPAEKYPIDKIAELNGILGGLAAAQAEYDALILKADGFLGQKDYAKAIDNYKAALVIKPTEEYPKNQLKLIDGILVQLAEAQRKYDALIKEADGFFVKQLRAAALPKYQGALEMKPAEIYPREQIRLINEKLNAEAQNKANYDALIAQADQFFQKTDYNSALPKYEQASLLMPAEKYPKDKMNEIRALLDAFAKKSAEYDAIIVKADEWLKQEVLDKSKEQYQLASAIFPDRAYPKDQILKIDELWKRKGQYEGYITEGDERFKAKLYTEALESFNKALVIMPEKEYPQKKIKEIQTILDALAMVKAAYDEAIRKGDAAFAISDFEVAKKSYQEALNQISTEAYPRQKIMEIDQILQDMARKKMQFDKIMAQANTAYDAKSYDAALAKYKQALEILPNEKLPQERILEINNILANMADKQGRFDALVAQGDQAFNAQDYPMAINLFEQAQAIFPYETYPPQKIAEAKAVMAKIQREIDVAYQKAIDEGDRNFKKRDWDPAKKGYQQASEIKPSELYPREKLAEINSILEKDLVAKQKEYDKYIADGERFYGTKYYREAILSFEKALGVFPFEKYPAEMIDKIFELIKKTSMVHILDEKMTIPRNHEEKFKFEPIAFKDRSENYILLEIRAVNPNEQVKLFVNFGNGGAQNGGYSIPLKNSDGYHSYFVSIGKQVRWVNQENDYISLLPEGGDVEVKLIKISRNGI